MSDFIIGHIRTWTPMIVGMFLTWLSDSLGIIIPEDASVQLVAGLVTLTSAVYYGLVRLLAERWGWIGYFLGYNQAPGYNQPTYEPATSEPFDL